jgi:putative GTP pyrophosphokinase
VSTLSNNKTDRLGERLRRGQVGEPELRLLDEHRRSFRTSYDFVVSTIRGRLGLEPTGRPAKSTGSIIDKLQRETIRLSQMQDIAGCRIVVADAPMQNRVVADLLAAFPEVLLVDRRVFPSYGYRAVHLIVSVEEKLIEIQVRTVLQNAWAELSEKFSDVVEASIKYGGGDGETRELLDSVSKGIALREDAENRMSALPSRPETDEKRRDLLNQMARDRKELLMACERLIEALEEIRD